MGSIWQDLYGLWQDDYDNAVKTVQDIYNFWVIDAQGDGTSENERMWRGIWNYLAYNGKDIPVLGWLWQMEDSRKYMTDYLKNVGLEWADVKYPTRLTGAGGFYSGAHGAVNFVSNNVLRLYR